MLNVVAVAGYRSLRELIMPLGPLNLITGPNGSGKSNVYRALRLLADTAHGSVVASLAREGGIDSTLWAGPNRTEPVCLRLGFYGDVFSYAIDLGLPIPRETSAFNRDPVIKTEAIWHGTVLRPASLLVERRGAVVRIRRGGSDWDLVTQHLQPFDSMMANIADPQRAADVLTLREQIRSWRFYDQFRTDAEAPARQPYIGTYTPVLAPDGRDLAAAMQTILEIGDAAALAQTIADAFPGSALVIACGDPQHFSVGLRQQGLQRVLSAAELSDGTLRYLLWAAALLTPRPPHLMILNEPEASLHPDLLPALARLIGVAAKQTQVIVVSHASRLIAALEQNPACQSVQLEKTAGATQILGQGKLDRPAWKWLNR